MKYKVIRSFFAVTAFMLAGCVQRHVTPPDIAGSYYIVIYGSADNSGLSHFPVAEGALVVTDDPFTDKDLPPAPTDIFSDMHYHSFQKPPHQYDVCLWLMPAGIDDGLTELASFVVTSRYVSNGETNINLYQSVDSDVNVHDIKRTTTGLTGTVESFFGFGNFDRVKQRMVATRDDKMTMNDCLQDGVHVAAAVDAYSDANSKMRETISEWFISKKNKKTQAKKE